MTTLKLKIVHRLLIKGLLDQRGNEGGSLSELNKMLKIIDRVGLTEAEVTKVNLRLEEGALRWQTKGPADEDLDPLTDLELTDDQAELIKATIKQKSDKKELKLVEVGPIMEIAEQLGLDVV
jgi:hypothetical protein